MGLTLTCRKCATEIVAPDEDELVRRVQEHVVQVHAEPGGHAHTPSREQVLTRLRHHERRACHGPADHGSPGTGAP